MNNLNFTVYPALLLSLFLGYYFFFHSAGNYSHSTSLLPNNTDLKHVIFIYFQALANLLVTITFYRQLNSMLKICSTGLLIEISSWCTS